jgi:hypothetical protein
MTTATKATATTNMNGRGKKGGKLDKSWKKFKMNQSTWRRSVRQHFYKLNSLGSKL